MKLSVAEVVLIRMQFHQSPGSKVRPALVLLDSGDDDFIAAPVTSQPKASEFDLVHRGLAGGELECSFDGAPPKLTVLPKADIVRRLGACSNADREAVSKLLCGMFCGA